MNLERLKEPLPISEVDFRIQSINKGGYATILAYKDARADMNRLDDVCGALNWKREHTRDNQNCIVSIWDDDKKVWVSKEDTGTESFTEKEKGLASDSFKRACFNWGIGRELYDYPVIQVKLNSNEFVVDGNRSKQTFNLQIRKWEWNAVFTGNKITGLIATDNHGKERFKWKDNDNTERQNIENIDIDIDTLKNEVMSAKSRKELVAIWNANPDLQKNAEFIKVFKEISEKFKGQ
jgi:hypothetical protein